MADPLHQLAQLGSDVWAFITILSIAYGALNCFYGYKIFKIVLGIVGFITGGLVAAGVAMAATKEPGIAVLAGLVGGATGAMLMVALYFLGVFVLGALVGGLLGAVAAAALGLQGEPALAVVGVLGLLGGVLAVVFQKLMIILSTAFSGAWSMVSGAAYFLLDLHPLVIAQNPLALQALGMKLYLLGAAWLVLGILGVLVQYKVTAPKTPPRRPPRQQQQPAPTTGQPTHGGVR